jgi:hypothetical protein
VFQRLARKFLWEFMAADSGHVSSSCFWIRGRAFQDDNIEHKPVSWGACVTFLATRCRQAIYLPPCILFDSSRSVTFQSCCRPKRMPALLLNFTKLHRPPWNAFAESLQLMMSSVKAHLVIVSIRFADNHLPLNCLLVPCKASRRSLPFSRT